MFRIMQDPSSGSDIQYLDKITNNGSIVQVLQMAYAAITLPTSVILAQLKHYL
jgi:hypothetical protein